MNYHHRDTSVLLLAHDKVTCKTGLFAYSTPPTPRWHLRFYPTMSSGSVCVRALCRNSSATRYHAKVHPRSEGSQGGHLDDIRTNGGADGGGRVGWSVSVPIGGQRGWRGQADDGRGDLLTSVVQLTRLIWVQVEAGTTCAVAGLLHTLNVNSAQLLQALRVHVRVCGGHAGIGQWDTLPGASRAARAGEALVTGERWTAGWETL